ncbi:mannose-1-phosphate guanylyltransferase [Clostridium beijerinckii]|uniref:mannose-1-phosphate guanylyltransferase n=1 Tax=Clostridium beijerinckii TaxID=1520 RepID=UPI0003D378BF|nr:mannose-1-phosphate guanylyltransferase [Clostridium beijerinckii]ALB44142.1 mannose-1-phosphate guanylyltransferase [Clostridium beijerinckii NRRL B-598]
MKIVAVIMAGGRGERFWPRSRKNMPKQFLNLTADGKTMIQHTVNRIDQLIDMEDIFIVTNKSYKDLVLEQLPDIKEENIILEPASRNTAPCIGLVSIYVKNKYKYDETIMIVLPSDHLIKYNEIFLDSLNRAIEIAKEEKNMVTIGITPSYPETGYGYIDFGYKDEDKRYSGAYKVNKFVEKPNLDKAKEYLASGKYLWNSGMFIWKTSTILNSFEEYLPEIYQGLDRIGNSIGTDIEEEVLRKEFLAFKSESIDYGIMEKCRNIYTIPGNFGWDDVGSWLALERTYQTNEDGNIVDGNAITIDVKNSIIQAKDKLVATVGVENIIVVDTEDAILICDKNSVQEVKKVIENLKVCNRNQYL